MKKTSTIITKEIFASLLPAICSVLGSNNILEYLQKEGYIGENIDIEFVKNCFVIAGIALTFILLTVNLIMREISEEKYKKQSQQLIKYNKDILINALAEYLGIEYCDLNIRIFVPDKSIYSKIKRLFIKNTPLWFHIKNIEGLAEPGVTNNLKFKVLPSCDQEGLVGECYNHKKMVYDDNLEVTNDLDYNLNEYQKSKTKGLKFIIVCPTFSKDKEIDAIVAFDSKNHIKVVNEDKFTTAILNYTQQLHEYVPELFKPKGGLM